MKQALKMAVLAVIVATMPLSLTAQEDRYRQAMEDIVTGLNQDNFDDLLRAVSERQMLGRISRLYPISPDVTEQVRQTFDEFVKNAIRQAVADADGREVMARLVDFSMEGGAGQALVRFSLPGHRFVYLRFDISADGRRLRVDDWVNLNRAERFSVSAAQSMVAALPSEVALRSLMVGENLDDNDLFLVREATKAFRDNAAQRFFEVVDGMRPGLLEHSFIVDLVLWISLSSGDVPRYEEAMQRRIRLSPDDPQYALAYADYFLMTQQFGNAVDALANFREEIGFDDGGLMSRMSAFALASGQNEGAAEYAQLATAAEPELKLAWWSLLRALAREDAFADCLPVLQRLEDDFGDKMTASRLRRDRYGAFNALSRSDEFKAWRAARE